MDNPACVYLMEGLGAELCLPGRGWDIMNVKLCFKRYLIVGIKEFWKLLH